MASVKTYPTVHIVNPKDPHDPAPQLANTSDVAKRGWTLWADRHDPKRAADLEKAATRDTSVVDPKPDTPVVDPKPDTPAGDDSGKPDEVKDGSAVDPSDVRKSPSQ